jgi:hypothetical protein
VRFWHAGCKGCGYLSDPPKRILPMMPPLKLLGPIMIISAVKAATALEKPCALLFGEEAGDGLEGCARAKKATNVGAV